MQPGLPALSAIPKTCYRLTIDIKDCFFSTLLHEENKQQFTFSVPATDHQTPMRCHPWKALPQETKASPTVCQACVQEAFWSIVKNCFVTHVLDDILVSCVNPEQLQQDLLLLQPPCKSLGCI